MGASYGCDEGLEGYVGELCIATRRGRYWVARDARQRAETLGAGQYGKVLGVSTRRGAASHLALKITGAGALREFGAYWRLGDDGVRLGPAYERAARRAARAEARGACPACAGARTAMGDIQRLYRGGGRASPPDYWPEQDCCARCEAPVALCAGCRSYMAVLYCVGCLRASGAARETGALAANQARALDTHVFSELPAARALGVAPRAAVCVMEKGRDSLRATAIHAWYTDLYLVYSAVCAICVCVRAWPAADALEGDPGIGTNQDGVDSAGVRPSQDMMDATDGEQQKYAILGLIRSLATEHAGALYEGRSLTHPEWSAFQDALGSTGRAALRAVAMRATGRCKEYAIALIRWVKDRRWAQFMQVYRGPGVLHDVGVGDGCAMSAPPSSDTSEVMSLAPPIDDLDGLLLTDVYFSVLWYQMVAAVAAVHAAGLLHRDIKPDNFLAQRARAELAPKDAALYDCLGLNVVSLCDFGMSRRLRSALSRAPFGVSLRSASGSRAALPALSCSSTVGSLTELSGKRAFTERARPETPALKRRAGLRTRESTHTCAESNFVEEASRLELLPGSPDSERVQSYDRALHTVSSLTARQSSTPTMDSHTIRPSAVQALGSFTARPSGTHPLDTHARGLPSLSIVGSQTARLSGTHPVGCHAGVGVTAAPPQSHPNMIGIQSDEALASAPHDGPLHESTVPSEALTSGPPSGGPCIDSTWLTGYVVTGPYRAVEILLSESRAGPGARLGSYSLAVDLWALGVTLVETLLPQGKQYQTHLAPAPPAQPQPNVFSLGRDGANGPWKVYAAGGPEGLGAKRSWQYLFLDNVYGHALHANLQIMTLQGILSVLGRPSDAELRAQGAENHPLLDLLKSYPLLTREEKLVSLARRVRSRGGHVCRAALGLAVDLLHFDPAQRVSCAAALRSPFFQNPLTHRILRALAVAKPGRARPAPALAHRSSNEGPPPAPARAHANPPYSERFPLPFHVLDPNHTPLHPTQYT